MRLRTLARFASRYIMAGIEDVAVGENLAEVRSRIQKAASDFGRQDAPRLVAVSKTKPMSLLQQAYDAGQRRFGENYVQELAEKAASPECPDDMEWHFIGHLQSNKCKVLASVKNLTLMETVSSIKLATQLDKAIMQADREPLDVYVQVNTSREENKHGVMPEECVQTCEHVIENCPHLRLRGIMTIGMIGRQVPEGENNPDFEELIKCRAAVMAGCGLKESEVEVSMGMSNDFEHAIQLGSTNVRVGSTIFGARAKPV